MGTAEQYRDMVDQVASQDARLRLPEEANRWDLAASRFRVDPHRPLGENLSAVAALLQPTDVLLDVGGGAGRISLPLAAMCREVVDVEPSAGMVKAFEACAADAGIANARAVHTPWLGDHGLAGDVALVCNVTYFVADIVPFVEKLIAATRRRVIIMVWSTPPPDRDAVMFEAATGEPLAPHPSFRELLPALWTLGVVPDVRVLPEPFVAQPETTATAEEQIDRWLNNARLNDRATARERLRAEAHSLFVATAAGYRRATIPNAQELLITWQTR